MGASVSLNLVGTGSSHTVKAHIDNSTVTASGRVSLDAENTASVHALGVGGSFAGSSASQQATSKLAGAAAAAYASNTVLSDTDAAITDSTVTAGGDIQVTADDSARLLRADAFGAAVAYAASTGGGSTGSLSLGMGIARNTVHNKSKARIERSKVTAGKNVGLDAGSGSNIYTLAIGVAGSVASGGTGGTTGALALAGAAATNAIDDQILAYISGSNGTNGVFANGGNLTLSATDTSNVRTDAGGFALALANGSSGAGTSVAGSVGAGVAISDIGNDTGHSIKAYVDASTVYANGNISVQADAGAQINTLSMAGSLAGARGQSTSVGIAGAGAFSFNTIKLDVEAYIANQSTATATGSGSISLSAFDTSSIDEDAGGVAIAAAMGSGSGRGRDRFGGFVRGDQHHCQQGHSLCRDFQPHLGQGHYH